MFCIGRSHQLRHFFSFFFFNDTATTEIYTLSLHDALPIYVCWSVLLVVTDIIGEGEEGLQQVGKRGAV